MLFTILWWYTSINTLVCFRSCCSAFHRCLCCYCITVQPLLLFRHPKFIHLAFIQNTGSREQCVYRPVLFASAGLVAAWLLPIRLPGHIKLNRTTVYQSKESIRSLGKHFFCISFSLERTKVSAVTFASSIFFSLVEAQWLQKFRLLFAVSYRLINLRWHPPS